MTNPTPTVCEECGYNLPHHAGRCSQATPLTWLCPDHRPSRPSNTDDGTTKRPCAVCGTTTRHGYR